MAERKFKLSDFQFNLPGHLLAEEPSQKRDQSRLMVVRRGSGLIEHKHFYEIGKYLDPNDLLIMNDTKVIPAKLVAYKENIRKGARLSVLLVEDRSDSNHFEWVMLIDPIRKIRLGTSLVFDEGGPKGVVKEFISEKEVLVSFPEVSDRKYLTNFLFSLGSTPLPPYIRREVNDSDRDRYQTVYANKSGALAAPTAGLHFTQDLLASLREKGVRQTFLTLHIGMGTFNPIHKENLDEVELHRERYALGQEAAEIINKTLKAGKKIVAVGTTSIRTLESVFNKHERITPDQGEANLFIRPGYNFGVNTSLITNFHTPGSSLLMLIAAYMGYDLMREVYDVAIAEEYRFYSYGDAMLILP
jgi:S-adenosylmethionine:tRNA ribosyltransferase-isomerase